MDLIFPNIEHKERAIVFKQEFFDSGETSISGGCGFSSAQNYEDWLNNIKRNLVNPLGNWVPSTTLFAVCDSKLIGIINIRHKLSDYLLKYGGHIGYSVAPSERRKGNATKILSLALNKCKKLGIKKVLITCDKINIGSAKTIINNGGVLENEVKQDDGDILQRYWIDINAM